MSLESLLSLEDVLDATGGVHVLGTGNFSFHSVHTDSREVLKGGLFVPLIGEVQDGHSYIPQALEKGASVVIIRMENYEKAPDFFTELSQKNPDVFFVAVENTLHALQSVAGRYVEKFPNLIRVAVTGSSGKTTTKEILAAILSRKYNLVCNDGNLNSETGLPLSVFKIRKEHELGLFEMGMSRKDEMAEISAVLKPRFAIITNIGTAHIGNLGSRENIASEKARIFDHFHSFGTAVIPREDDFASFLETQVDGNVVFYGEGLDEGITSVTDCGLEGTSFKVDGHDATLCLPGKYNFRNALGAIAMARVLDVSSEEIAKGISSLKPMFGRSQVLHGKYTVVQDCYNANPDSMEKALDLVSSLGEGTKRILVLGDMLELGDESKAEHERVGILASHSGASLVLFSGDEMKAAYEAFKSENNAAFCEYVPGKSDGAMEKIASLVLSAASEGCVILVKGSRGMRLERVVSMISEAN